MNHQERAVFDWLTGEPTPAAAAAWRRALQADPELLARLLDEVRFDHQLSRCLAEASPAASDASETSETPAADPATSLNADQQKIWARIVAQAWADESYKTRLLAEPAAVLREEGLELPAGVSVSVVESRDARAYLVLPAPPPDARPSAEHELRLAAGNGCAGGCSW